VVLGRPADPGDAETIRTAMEDQWAAWNSGHMVRDGDFTPDCDYVTFDGTELHGLEENRRAHDQFGRGALRGSVLTGKVRRVRFITPDVAVVHSTGNLRLRFHRRPKPGRDSVQTTVMRKTADGWRIEAFQNTRVRRRGPLFRMAVWLARKL
jgi:uncharacterized protein (TIGR02246 family)